MKADRFIRDNVKLDLRNEYENWIHTLQFLNNSDLSLQLMHIPHHAYGYRDFYQKTNSFYVKLKATHEWEQT